LIGWAGKIITEAATRCVPIFGMKGYDFRTEARGSPYGGDIWTARGKERDESGAVVYIRDAGAASGPISADTTIAATENERYTPSTKCGKLGTNHSCV